MAGAGHGGRGFGGPTPPRLTPAPPRGTIAGLLV